MLTLAAYLVLFFHNREEHGETYIGGVSRKQGGCEKQVRAERKSQGCCSAVSRSPKATQEVLAARSRAEGSISMLGRAALHQEARPPRMHRHEGQPDANKHAAQVEQQSTLSQPQTFHKSLCLVRRGTVGDGSLVLVVQ